ncbi:MAG: ribosome assembly factor SBDS, partial [Nanoarchaeota archaeon]
MTQTTARIKAKGKNFEILVDLDSAVKFKKTGLGRVNNILEIDFIYSDQKRGFKAGEKDLMECFGIDDVYKISETILKNGEILLTQEYRDEEKDKKIKQAVEFLSKNAVDPRTGLPHTPDRIKSVLEEAGVNINSRPIEEQIPEIIEKISGKIAIRIQTKRIKIVIPAIHTGKAYG